MFIELIQDYFHFFKLFCYFLLYFPVGEPYTQKCDIFSFAITLWEMLARKVPTVSASEQHNTYAILFQMAEGEP